MQISYRQILSGGISQKASDDDALRKLNDCHCQEKDYDKKHYPFILLRMNLLYIIPARIHPLLYTS